MADIQFKQYRNPFSGEIDPTRMWYTDTDGNLWNIIEGSWQWNEIYLPWLAAGNTPLPAD